MPARIWPAASTAISGAGRSARPRPSRPARPRPGPKSPRPGGPGAGDQPTWSPDGKQIAYQSSSTLDSADSIWIMDANGAYPHYLTSGSRPSWSPNGRWIAFVRDTSQGSDLWMISADGGHAVRITDDAGLKGRPTWVG